MSDNQIKLAKLHAEYKAHLATIKKWDYVITEMQRRLFGGAWSHQWMELTGVLDVEFWKNARWN